MKKTFKKLWIIVFAVVMAFSTASCASFMDEVVFATFREVGNEFTQTVSLIGSWRSGETSWLFDTDGSGTFKVIGSVSFKWSASSDQLTITFDTGLVVVYTFNIKDNVLTLTTVDGSSNTYTR